MGARVPDGLLLKLISELHIIVLVSMCHDG